MKVSLTERDKKMLTGLIVFLIVVVAGYFIIYPLTRKCIEYRGQVTAAEELKQDNEQKVQLLPSMEIQSQASKQNVDEISEQFYPILASEDIDHLLTGIVLQKGLEAKSLQITMPEGEVSLSPYQYSSLVDLEANQEEAAQTEESEDTQTDATTEEPVVVNGLYAASVTLVATGNEEALHQLLDELANDYSAMRMTAMSWNDQANISMDLTAVNGAQTNVSVGKSLTISLDIYMYDANGSLTGILGEDAAGTTAQ